MFARWVLVALVLRVGVVAAAEPHSPTVSALRVPGPLSQRNANYRLRAKLDEANHSVSSEGTLTWRNLERQSTDRLVFHLYQNAFKNHASNFISEVGAQLRGDAMQEHGFGAIDVTKLKVNGRDVLGSAVLDDTLLSVPLQSPIGPSATVEIELAFTVKLPKVFARSGYSDSYHAVTQWFPKIGVFECDDPPPAPPPPPDAILPPEPPPRPATACRWRAHQYHGITEFFSDYGVYDVELDVPAATVVGASGVLVSEQPNGDRRLLRYHAEDVHDFAFFTDPRFVEVHDRIDDEFGSVDVRLLTRPDHTGYSQRHLDAVRAALLEAERRLGVYPYANVTVVIPPWAGRGSGGMEYPTIFTSIPLPLPGSIRAMEGVTAHEFLHQFFYGILGSDEVEEAWLDEGMNETITTWVLDRMFGPRCSTVDTPFLCISSVDEEWLAYRTATGSFPIAARGFTLPVDVYGEITYSQTTIAMRTLERYLGEARMSAGLRRYAERFRFRHPKKADFVAAMSEGAREDLSWFFSQALDSTRIADYQVVQADTQPHELAAGLWDCPPRPLPTELVDVSDPVDKVRHMARSELARESAQAACRVPGKKDTPDAEQRPPGRYELNVTPGRDNATLHDSVVTVQRRGEFIFPIDIVATFQDGSRELITWSVAEQRDSGETRNKILHFPRRKSPLLRAEVDPENTFILDENRLNNGLNVEPQRRPVARLYLTLVGMLSTFFDLLGA